jgi:hypothetical protein
MLGIALSRVGRRLAATIAFAYLACTLMPSLALALSGGAMAADCFDEIAGMAAPVQAQVHVHVHADGTVHVHHDDHHQLAAHEGSADNGAPPHHHDHQHDANCCGAYGFAAVLPSLSVPLTQPRALVSRAPMVVECLVGCAPDRIDRPPRSAS